MRSFIYSLPRSGSAWLSMFLTGRNSFCFHEPLSEKIPVEQMFERRPEPSICAVDTLAYMSDPQVGKRLGAKCFVLLRDPLKIAESLDRAGMHGYDPFAEIEKLHKVTDGFVPIYHAEFNDMAYLREVFEMVTEQKFDLVRAKALRDMNVTRDIDKFLLHVGREPREELRKDRLHG